MTKFRQGQFVRPTAKVQGMTMGQHYIVDGIEEQPTAFGTFVTYVLRTPDNKHIRVVNGHVVLEAVTLQTLDR